MGYFENQGPYFKVWVFGYGIKLVHWNLVISSADESHIDHANHIFS